MLVPARKFRNTTRPSPRAIAVNLTDSSVPSPLTPPLEILAAFILTILPCLFLIVPFWKKVCPPPCFRKLPSLTLFVFRRAGSKATSVCQPAKSVMFATLRRRVKASPFSICVAFVDKAKLVPVGITVYSASGANPKCPPNQPSHFQTATNKTFFPCSNVTGKNSW